MENIIKEMMKLKRQIAVDKIAAGVSAVGAIAGGVVAVTQIMGGNELGGVGWATLSLTNAVNAAKSIRDIFDNGEDVRELADEVATKSCIVPAAAVENPHNTWCPDNWENPSWNPSKSTYKAPEPDLCDWYMAELTPENDYLI